MPSLLISGGTLFSLLCSARVRHCLRLLAGIGVLVWESLGKADLLSDHFNGKQSSEPVDLPLT